MHGREDKQVECIPNLFGKSRATSELQGASEFLNPFRHACQRFREAERGQRTDNNLGVVDTFSKFERMPA